MTDRWKLQTVGPLSPEVPKSKCTNNPTPSTSHKGDSPASYAGRIRQRQLKYKPSFEKLEELKESLKAK